jgi:translation initiation factor IF-2
LPQDKVALKILKLEAGNINESDVKLAQSSGATILGFRVKTDSVVKRILTREKIRIMTFDIIYDLVEGVHKLMEKIVSPEDIRKNLGRMRVLAKFLTEKNRQIIGGRVTEGEVKKGSQIEVLRGSNEEKVGQGRMINLQRNKKDADLIQKGEECGILFEGNVAIEEGDTLSFYVEERIKGTI